MVSGNKSLVLLLAIALAGCSTLQTRDQVRASRPKTPVTTAPGGGHPPPETMTQEDEEEGATSLPDLSSMPTPPPTRIPKVGLILGPGGARAYAHIGVLQEFQKEKIPVVAAGGVEWGAVIAALYVNKGLANEAEWQMSKLKSEDVVRKSLIGGSGAPGDLRGLGDFLKLAFGRSKAEEARLPFACPANNLSKNQVFLMNKGTFEQMLPFCLAYPPAFRPWQGNVSAVREVKMLADHLRARGATTIVLVNVLGLPNVSRPVAGGEGSAESVMWNEISAFYSRPLPGVDQVLTIPLGNTSVMAFDGRREILQKGSEKGAPLVRQLAQRLGL
ncbi:MAG: alpha/beta hydrolase [Bdellovibrionaceae bacterium]|nr:alpha/beta hydrolase [Pseudobdellovibrionaceae bacterium]